MIKAIYLDEKGYDHDTKQAREAGLVQGEEYEVDYAEVGGWRSDVFLVGFPNESIQGTDMGFNSVMFDYFDEDGKEIDIVEVYLQS